MNVAAADLEIKISDVKTDYWIKRQLTRPTLTITAAAVHHLIAAAILKKTLRHHHHHLPLRHPSIGKQASQPLKLARQSASKPASQ